MRGDGVAASWAVCVAVVIVSSVKRPGILTSRRDTLTRPIPKTWLTLKTVARIQGSRPLS